MNARIESLIRRDPGLASVYAAGLGQAFDLISQVDDHVFRLLWGYADAHRLALATTFASSDQDALRHIRPPTLTSESGVIISLINGCGEEMAQGLYGSVFSFNLAHAAATLTMNLDKFRLAVQSAPMIRGTSGIIKPPAFIVDFQLPIIDDMRILQVDQTVVSSDVAVTLEKVSVTPSQVRVHVCCAGLDSSFEWTAIARLVTPRDSYDNGTLQHRRGDTVCQESLFDVALYDYEGDWKVVVNEMVGISNTPGGKQRRIQGEWGFAFKL